MRKIFTGCLVLILLLLTAWPTIAQITKASSSVLSVGTWLKVGITNTGIYKIDGSFLKAAGISAAAINPQHLKLYGNGGGMLPQPNSAPRPDDLIQNAIWVAGEADGKFDPEDYLLFYGQGPHTWTFNAGKNRFEHAFNIYTDTAYYFLNLGNTPGLRVKTQSEIKGATQVINTFSERQFHEQDLNKPLPSGREWYGEILNSQTSTRSFSFPAAPLVPGSTIWVASAVMGSSPVNSQFTLHANNNPVGTQLINGQGSHDYHALGEENLAYFSFINPNQSTSPDLNISLTFQPLGHPSATGYLNYLEVTTQRYLKLTGNQMAFRSLQNISAGAISEFRLENSGPTTEVWEVTNPLRPQVMRLQKKDNTAAFTIKTDSLREFISFTGTDFTKPASANKINNQNLHALNLNGNLDFVIITHPLFKPAAEKLAAHRQAHDNLEVAVVTINQVYNEFSSGAPDVTAIRDFMRLLYNRSTQAQDGRLYLLLLGDASYDYKSGMGNAKTRTPHNTNFVPVYESRQSLDPLTSFSSEDYFGLLDAHEGLWSETDLNTPEKLDIGIGRLPAKTASEANNLVNKIIHYDSPLNHGSWRNQVTLLADDGDNTEHLRDAESLASYLEENQPAYNLQKLYLDFYKQIAQPNGQRSPETNAALHKAIDKGTLLLNYTGHGNEVSLAHERILTVPEINSWQNYDRLPFMLIATCEFGRYDDPRRNSGAEVALLHARGGTIGLLTTTRPVFASNNRVLNRHFLENAFTPVNGQMRRMGEIYRLTKNQSQANVNNRNFTLLGDPTQRLAYPQLQATLTHLNNVPLTSAAHDTLKALSKSTLSGLITDEQGNHISTFNGQIKVVVLEKPGVKKTLGDESNGTINNYRNVKVQEDIIYSGSATVTNGKFSFNFVLPKDISYPVGPGKISLYAFNQTTDAHGVNTKILIGGSNPNTTPDTTPPQIKLFLNDETFVSGGLTGNNPRLLAHLTDSSGINTTTTRIGHEIVAILDGNKTQPIVLNDYFTTAPDNFQSGTVSYPMPQLTPGEHTLTLKAWDTHNNSAEASIKFLIADQEILTLKDTFNYPNPFSTNTTFSFGHNLAGDDLAIQIQIYTTSGSLVKIITAQRMAAKTRIADINWDGTDNLNRPLTPGLYIYQVRVKSVQRGISSESFNKLIILN